MKRVTAVAAALALAVATATAAQSEMRQDGNELLRYCRAETDDGGNRWLAGWCSGFVWGVSLAADSWRAQAMEDQSCRMPDGVTGAQLVRIVVSYLEQHPEELHEDQLLLVTRAMTDAFPCKKEN